MKYVLGGLFAAFISLFLLSLCIQTLVLLVEHVQDRGYLETFWALTPEYLKAPLGIAALGTGGITIVLVVLWIVGDLDDLA